MTRDEVMALDNGDEVYWNDPDEGTCSRYLTIQTIDVNGEVVVITDKQGLTLECLASELS